MRFREEVDEGRCRGLANGRVGRGVMEPCFGNWQRGIKSLPPVLEDPENSPKSGARDVKRSLVYEGSTPREP